MSLQYVLNWLVPVGALFGLLGLQRFPQKERRAWALTHISLLATWAAVRIVAGPQRSAWVFALELLFVALPQRLVRHAAAAAMIPRWGRASTYARIAGWLHPFGSWPSQGRLVHALALWDAGQESLSRQQFERLTRDPEFRQHALLRPLGLSGQWEEMLSQLRAESGESRDEALLGRALGECGNIDALHHWAARINADRQLSELWKLSWLYVTVFSGLPEATRQLIRHGFPTMGDEMGTFWHASAQQCAGQWAAARVTWQRLGNSESYTLRSAAAQRLRCAGAGGAELQRSAPPAPETPAANREREARHALVEHVHTAIRTLAARTRPPKRPWFTYAVVFLNLGVFSVYHDWAGKLSQTEYGMLLFDAGALVVPLELANDESWRILTAGFLHFGPVHLAFNCFVTTVLGRSIETQLGPARTAWIYFSGVIGGNLWFMWFTEGPALVVGASGAVMALLGSQLTRVALEYRKRRTPQLLRPLFMLLLVMAVQIVFDINTEQVAGSVHLSGFAIGMFAGWLVMDARRNAAA